jgi:hypothetical protein
MVSATLSKMIEDKKGYRTENYSGSLIRNLYDVIRHELSMGNTDIVSYVQEHYKILGEYIVEDAAIEELKEKFHNPEEYNQAYWERFSDICQENSIFIADDIVKYVAEQLSVPSNYLIGLWLSTYENVVGIYNNGNTDDIDEYPLIDNNYFVISDLGADGALFVFKE